MVYSQENSVLAASGTVMAATQDLTVKAEMVPSCIFGAPATLDFGTLSLTDLKGGKVKAGGAAWKITSTIGAVPAKLYGAANRLVANGLSTLAHEGYTVLSRTVVLTSSNSAFAARWATGWNNPFLPTAELQPHRKPNQRAAIPKACYPQRHSRARPQHDRCRRSDQ